MFSLRWLFFSEEEEAAAASEIAMASFLQLLLLFLRLSGNIFARTPTSPPISENDIIERRRRHSNAVGEEEAADPNRSSVLIGAWARYADLEHTAKFSSSYTCRHHIPRRGRIPCAHAPPRFP